MNSKRLPIVLLSLILPNIVSAATIESLWRDSQGGLFRSPTRSQLTAVEDLFVKSFHGEFSEAQQMTMAWSKLGFDVEEVSVANKRYWVIREVSGQYWGRGFYVICRNCKNPVLIQAPHSYFDLHSASIALRLLEEGQFIAGAWNTVRRRCRTGNRCKDLAHDDVNHYNAFTRAFARAYSSGIIAQLHGFSQGKRKTAQAAESDIIVSAGTRLPTRLADQMSRCLRRSLSAKVGLFPVDVLELGGTRNAQGKVLRSLGHNGFVHIELSQLIRQEIRNDLVKRSQLRGCLEALTG